MIDHLKRLMLEGTPVYHIEYGRVCTSSIASVTLIKDTTYITLDDGSMVNTANLGTTLFWTRPEGVTE